MLSKNRERIEALETAVSRLMEENLQPRMRIYYLEAQLDKIDRGGKLVENHPVNPYPHVEIQEKPHA